MALTRLPGDVQAMLCATAYVNSYKRAIEELVYNSLDAKSTSIAIRINIQNDSLQVIDNGRGILKTDLNVLGQRYMTSKITDLSTLKSTLESYGYRGEFIANIIKIAQQVKITSRHESQDDTWSKTFVDGKEKKVAKMSTRPSKGTSVEVKGFLYNANIIKRGIDATNEMQNVKSFFEQLSLVHNNVSVSLRDDSKNEIVFKMHKKRDIYHTLLSLFDIDENCVQELSVEKSQYKVKAIVGKAGDINKHWIYLNNRFVNITSKLHKIMNDYLKKYMLKKDKKYSKFMTNDSKQSIFIKNIPFYFLFITCPYLDYDINFTTKETGLEFKNWKQVKKLFEKLVTFYVRDVNSKLDLKPKTELLIKETSAATNIKCNQETRDQVKKIMEKILGNSPNKKVRVTQIQNGVKGKIIKRKTKKPLPLNRIANISNALINNKISICNINAKGIKIQQDHQKNIEKIIMNQNIDSDIKIENIRKKKSKHYLKKDKSDQIHKMTSCTKAKEKKIVKYQKLRTRQEKSPLVSNALDKIIVQQKTKDFVPYQSEKNTDHKNINNNFQYYNHNFIPKINTKEIEKYLKNKVYERNRFKTTYDLINPISFSQNNYTNNEDVEKPESLPCNILKNHKKSYVKSYQNFQPTRMKLLETISPTQLFYCRQLKQSENFNTCGRIRYKLPSDACADVTMKKIPNNASFQIKSHKIIENTHYMSGVNLIEIETSNYTQRNKIDSELTYDSHAYCGDCYISSRYLNLHTQNTKSRLTRFITKQSTDNFITIGDNYKPKYKQKPTHKNYNINKQTIFNNISKIMDEYYSINCSENIENNKNFNNSKKENIKQFDTRSVHVANSFLTYTLPISSLCTGSQGEILHKSNRDIRTNCGRYTIHYSGTQEFLKTSLKTLTTSEPIIDRNKNLNVVFVSDSQDLAKQIEPLNVCETIMSNSVSVHTELNFTKIMKNVNDSLYDYEINNNTLGSNIVLRQLTPLETKMNNHADNNCASYQQPPLVTNTENVSNHFVYHTDNKIGTTEELTKGLYSINHGDIDQLTIEDFADIIVKNNYENVQSCENNFHFKDRLRFLPKGMSQIFENRQSIDNGNYDPDIEYFENGIYDNFANNVQVNSEIYEPIIQNVDEFITKPLQKLENKLKSDNASLVFDQDTLNKAKVLGQVDCKFIVSVISRKNKTCEIITEYLVLFDQHAVSERISLEKNLSEYLAEEKWTSVSLDNVILILCKDDIIYLHNYKDKFIQLGLEWNIVNDSRVIFNTIPKAILGKYPREVDKIIKAVRNLISEQINAIKLQKGCVSLYPKSIMDLVFSEACRYAIKFGDKLSRSECENLLKALSYCKAPFQCAHGRPVMAVLVDLKENEQEYKIDICKLKEWRSKNVT